jgi:hypothetical protein
LLLNPLVSFSEDPRDAAASLAIGLLVQCLEHLFETGHVAFGFVAMGLECFPEFLGTGGIRQLGKRLHELLFGIVDVLQLVDE